MSGELTALLSSQHRRHIATVMGHVEREVYPCLTPAQRKDLRDVILRAAGAYHDTALDCVKASSAADESTLRNERLFDLLESIHRAVNVPRART